MFKYWLISFILTLVYFSHHYVKPSDYSLLNSNIMTGKNLFLTSDFSSLRDTLYTFDSVFVEVNLARQKAYLHKKSGDVKEFLISSGTARLLDGVETQEGLFVIKAKLKEWHSRQFDSTLLINWIGFNHGIGFHALQGTGYYRYLGKKRSSHGCIRISRESSNEIFNAVEKGTPVLVHNGNNAVTIGFASKFENYFSPGYYELVSSLPERYKNIYSGRYFISPQEKIAVNSKNVYHSGLPIGDSKRIPRHQRIIPVVKAETAVPDKSLSLASFRKIPEKETFSIINDSFYDMK